MNEGGQLLLRYCECINSAGSPACCKATITRLIGVALGYAKSPLPRLRHYLEDGRVEIDNNQIENKIRPLALGRKSYLFAGSNKRAERAAMIYSFASCKANDINPSDWLRDVLVRIGRHPINRVEELLPAQWGKSRGMDL